MGNKSSSTANGNLLTKYKIKNKNKIDAMERTVRFKQERKKEFSLNMEELQHLLSDKNSTIN